MISNEFLNQSNGSSCHKGTEESTDADSIKMMKDQKGKKYGRYQTGEVERCLDPVVLFVQQFRQIARKNIGRDNRQHGNPGIVYVDHFSESDTDHKGKQIAWTERTLQNHQCDDKQCLENIVPRSETEDRKSRAEDERHDGKYDIGFCSDLLKSEELEYYPLRESYIAAAVPEGHPLEGKENITLKEAAKYPQVMFSRTSGFRSLQEQIFAEQGIQVKPVCEAEEIEVITGLVENGFGISILPYMDIVRLHHITAIPVQTSSWKSKFYIARRKYGIRTAQEEAFFQHWRK